VQIHYCSDTFIPVRMSSEHSG